MSPRTLRTAVAAAALTVPLAAAPGALAQESTRAQIGGGETTLRLASGTAAALTDAGVRVTPVRPATTEHGALRFPVTGGRADPRTLRGSVEHSGGIRFRAGGRSVVLSDLTYRVGRTSTLTAEVGGDRITVLSLNLRRATVRREGLGARVTGIRANLTSTAARALNDAFDTTLFRRGLNLGRVASTIAPSEVVFTGGATALAVEPSTAQALTGLGVALAPVDPAQAREDGRVAFPITGGRVDAESLAGTVRHSGGIALSAGSTRVELTDFEIEIDDSPSLFGQVGGQRVELFSLDVSGLTREVEGRRVTVGGVVLRLTAGAAQALNAAFGTTALAEGLVVGTATVEGRAR